MATPHNSAKKGDIAKTVLMSGDPLRAKFIADTFLTDVTQFNTVRNMFGFTGLYKGKKVSVMGHGMGMPSIAIYVSELYKFYDVERIIRIGSAGAYVPEVKLFDIVIAQAVCTDSSFANQYKLPGTFSAIGTYDLIENAVTTSKKLKVPYHVGNVMCSDNFYSASFEDWKKWANMGCLCVEMESYALYCLAAYYHKEALAILTASDSLVTDEVTTSEQRQTGFTNMMEVALSLIK